MRLLLLLFLAPLAAEGRIMEAIQNVLNYYLEHIDEASHHIMFGVLLTKGQLNAHALDFGGTSEQLGNLLETCDKIFEKKPLFYITNDTVNEVTEAMRQLKTIEPKQLMKQDLPSYRLETSIIFGSPSPGNSTYCLWEVMINAKVSDMCLQQMADADARGYTIAHQVIYYSLAASILPLSTVQESIKQRCEKMLSEVNYIMENGMPEQLRDLVIEEVAVCGMSKYQDFLTEPMLDFILGSQREEGCFSIAKEGPLNKCDSHFSTVSLLALTSFLFADAENLQNML